MNGKTKLWIAFLSIALIFSPLSIAVDWTPQGNINLRGWYSMIQAIDVNATGEMNAATLNTGQGDNELYAMNQDVESTDAVTFATVDTGQGANELYAMDQDVETTDDVTFGSLTLTGFTNGSMIFISEDGKLAQDNSALFWDATDKKFAIGSNAKMRNFFQAVTDDAATDIDATHAVMSLRNIDLTNDNLGIFSFQTYDDAGSTVTSGVRLITQFLNHQDNNVSADFSIETTNEGTKAQRLWIKSDGKVGIGTSTPATALDVNGTITADTLSITDYGLAEDDIPTLSSTWDNSMDADRLTGLDYLNSKITLAGENITSGTVAKERIEDAYVFNTGDNITGDLIFEGSAAVKISNNVPIYMNTPGGTYRELVKVDGSNNIIYGGTAVGVGTYKFGNAAEGMEFYAYDDILFKLWDDKAIVGSSTQATALDVFGRIKTLGPSDTGNYYLTIANNSVVANYGGLTLQTVQAGSLKLLAGVNYGTVIDKTYNDGIAGLTIDMTNAADPAISTNGTITAAFLDANQTWVHQSYPAACPGSGAITHLGDSVTCSDLWVDEAGDTMTGTLTIDQDTDAKGLYIDSEATTAANYGIDVNTGQGATAASFQYGTDLAYGLVRIGADPNVTSTTTAQSDFYRNLASTHTARPLVSIRQDHSTDDQNALSIQQDGTGEGLYINQDGAGTGLKIAQASSTTGAFLAIRDGSQTFTSILREDSSAAGTNYFYRNLAAASTAGPVMNVVQDNTGDDQIVLDIQQDGSGHGVFIDNNGNGSALKIQNAGTGANANGIFIDSINGGIPLSITTGDTERYMVYVARNNVGATEPVAYFKEDAATAQDVIRVVNDGTGKGLFIDQNGNGIALEIDSEATTAANAGLKVTTGQGASAAKIAYDGNMYLNINTPSDATASMYVYRNYASGTTNAPMMTMTQANAGDDQTAVAIYQAGTGRGLFVDNDGTNIGLEVQQDGAGNGLFIDQNGNGKAISIDSESTTSSVMEIEPDVLTSGSGLIVDTASSVFTGATSGGLVVFKVDDVSATGTALLVRQDGTGIGQTIDQNSDAVGLDIDSEATTATKYGINIDTAGADAANFQASESNYARLGRSTAASNWFYRDLGWEDTDGSLVLIQQDNSSDDMPALRIQQVANAEAIYVANTGTDNAIYLDQNGDGNAFYIDSEATTHPGIEIVMVDANKVGVNTNGYVLSANTFNQSYIFTHTNSTIPVASAGVWYNVTFEQMAAPEKYGIAHTYNDATNDTFTIETTGTYQIYWHVGFLDSAASPSAHVATRLIKNGAEVCGSVFERDTSKQNSVVGIHHGGIASFTAGDTMKVQFTASATTVSLITTGTYGDCPSSSSVMITRID